MIPVSIYSLNLKSYKQNLWVYYCSCFLSISFSICFWCLKEPSLWAGSFMYHNTCFGCKRKLNFNCTLLHGLINFFLASCDFCCLLITFANSLDPAQAWQNVRPDLGPNCLTLWYFSWNISLKKVGWPQKHENLTSMQRVNLLFSCWRCIIVSCNMFCKQDAATLKKVKQIRNNPFCFQACSYGATYHEGFSGGFGRHSFGRRTDHLRSTCLDMSEWHLHPPSPRYIHN